jgi:hypothetical protein
MAFVLTSGVGCQVRVPVCVKRALAMYVLQHTCEKLSLAHQQGDVVIKPQQEMEPLFQRRYILR